MTLSQDVDNTECWFCWQRFIVTITNMDDSCGIFTDRQSMSHIFWVSSSVDRQSFEYAAKTLSYRLTTVSYLREFLLHIICAICMSQLWAVRPLSVRLSVCHTLVLRQKFLITVGSTSGQPDHMIDHRPYDSYHNPRSWGTPSWGLQTRQVWVEIAKKMHIFDQYRKSLHFRNDRRQSLNCDGSLKGNHIQAFDWYQFRWPGTAITHHLTLHSFFWSSVSGSEIEWR